jgi:hypothetical protein
MRSFFRSPPRTRGSRATDSELAALGPRHRRAKARRSSNGYARGRAVRCSRCRAWWPACPRARSSRRSGNGRRCENETFSAHSRASGNPALGPRLRGDERVKCSGFRVVAEANQGGPFGGAGERGFRVPRQDGLGVDAGSPFPPDKRAGALRFPLTQAFVRLCVCGFARKSRRLQCGNGEPKAAGRG